jgi:CubicO group peptidase (beta-lactamase class C family)
MDPAWRDVTLAMLLTNTSGAPNGLAADGLWKRLWERRGTPVEERRKLVAGVLARAPEAPPGKRNVYSNAGFSIAGAMLETVTGKPYEALLAAELFAPLGMARAGFGAPGDPAAPAAGPTDPLGHTLRGGELQPRELGFGDDNPPAIAPAGRVHAPLADWARYAALHLAAARGEELPEAFRGVDFAALHRPRLARYAMGWMVLEPGWSDGPVLWHNGSNTMWYCEIAILPKEDLAVLVATNTAHGATRDAVAAVARALRDRFASAPAPAPASR